MDILIVVALLIVMSLFLFRLFAARRVAARQGQFIWLMHVPSLLGGVVILWASIQMFGSAPLVGVVIAVTGVVYLAFLVRFLISASRSVSSTGSQDLATAITGPLADYMSVMVVLGLIAGLVALVGLIIWGVFRAAG